MESFSALALPRAAFIGGERLRPEEQVDNDMLSEFRRILVLPCVLLLLPLLAVPSCPATSADRSFRVD